MKEKNILIAFILNIAFSIIEFIGGFLTNSIAIMSDAVHDLGDASSIGISYFLEKKSKKKPDDDYTYGYLRFSVLGAFITIVILLVGSIFVIYHSIIRLINPVTINYNGMIALSIFGVIVNFIAAYVTHGGDSLNEKSVNLHMLEDVLGWIIVLVGAIVIKFSDITYIDSIMSILVSLFILYNAFLHLKEITNIFLVKTPSNINIDDLKKHILEIDKIEDVHHIHIWTMDGVNNYATLHIKVKKYLPELKQKVKEELAEHNIIHSTIEFEDYDENCHEAKCEVKLVNKGHSHSHEHKH